MCKLRSLVNEPYYEYMYMCVTVRVCVCVCVCVCVSGITFKEKFKVLRRVHDWIYDLNDVKLCTH